MAVVTVYGMTQSGKSFFVKTEFLKQTKRQIIFDIAHCFDGGEYIKLKSQRDVLKAFRKYSKKEKYKLIFRPDRSDDFKVACDLLISLSCALGRALCPRYNELKRVWLVIDEADKVCSSHYQSKQVKHLVNMGRHDNVDSVFIARMPTRLHTDIRANSSRIVSFRLQTAPQVKEFVENFGRENARKIRDLAKYHRFEWRDNGETKVFSDKNKEVVIDRGMND